MKKSETYGGHYYDKYRSKNPLVKLLVDRYIYDIKELVRGTNATHILDVGCGEGYVMDNLKDMDAREFIGIDISEDVLKDKAKKNNPDVDFVCNSVYHLCFKESSFDLVSCCEVLEHLTEPADALKEIRRVSGEYVLISVPYEPYWRIANILRLCYLKDFGNTPGHIQHFGLSGLKDLLEAEFAEVRIKSSAIWLIALCKLKKKRE